MPAASIDDVKLAKKKTSPLLDRLAKQAILKAFKRIELGRLVIEDDGEVYAFGQEASETQVVVTISVHDSAVYRRVVMDGSIGAAESYMLGFISVSDLLNLVRVFVLNMDVLNAMDSSTSLFSRIPTTILHWLNANTKKGSRRNIGAHYDLGNDFFELILDQRMMYSSAIFPHGQASLDEAAEHKLDTICKKLQLCPEDHLLEIGTGWGGMAIYAAKHYGCRVTTTTISRQQYEYAKAWVEREGLSDRIELLLEDYRDLTGKYDKLVSVEMIEAVGHKYYKTYFQKCSSLLKPEGLMLIQAITIADQRYMQAKKSVDFIQKYIFPGGCLPSNEVIAKNVSKHTDLQIVGLEDITSHYARTLREWRERFHAKMDEVKDQGFKNTFVRMWEFYLCYCEGGFTERVISTAQVVFAKPRARLA